MVITPVIDKMQLGGHIAEALTLGTILHESVVGNTQYLAQHNLSESAMNTWNSVSNEETW